MAGAGWRQFTTEPLASDVVQQFLMDQTVLAFDSASQRGAELLVPEAGMVTYLRDEDRLEARTPSAAGALTGGTWRGIGRHWGTVTTLPAPVAGNPATPQPGDMAYCTPWRCNAIVTGVSVPTWRQVEPAQVGTVAGRDTFASDAADVGAPLPAGFLVLVTSNDRLYVRLDDATWRLIGGKAGATIALGTAGGAAQTGWGALTGSLRHNGNGTATVYLEVTRAGADIAVPSNGDMATSPVVLLPPGWEAAAPTTLVSGLTGRLAAGHMSTGQRTVNLTAVAGSVNVVTGDTISLGATYPLLVPQGLED